MAYLEITRTGSIHSSIDTEAGTDQPRDHAGGVEKAQLDGGPTSVGRHVHNLIVLNDQDVSRHHCVIDKEGTAFTLRDLESHNGTRINGCLLDHPTRLQDGDIITVGQTAIKFIHRPIWKKLVDHR